MRKSRHSPLRGSVTQNTQSVRLRAREQSGISFLTKLGVLGLAILLLAGGGFWLWHSGWIGRQIEATQQAGLMLSQQAHFAVRDIAVQGRSQENKDAIFDALATERGAPIFAFDSREAAARLSKLPWVDHVTIERRLPDTINVAITERMPLARWQHDDHLAVIDTNGHILNTAQPDHFDQLPLVVGSGADHAAQDFLTLLKSYPDIQNKMMAAVRVGDRRWDVHLQPKITVRLPENDTANALHRLLVLINEQKILDRDIVAIDLRMTDRLVIEPATEVKPVGGTKS